MKWMRSVPGALATAVLVILACKPPVHTTPPPAEAPPELAALAGSSIMVGAGDIGACDSRGDDSTAVLVDSILHGDSVAKVNDAVFTLGDNAYPTGSTSDYVRCFTPSWGDSSRMIMRKIHPTPGNHETLSDMAAPYYDYFGKSAGSSKKGYYSYDIGDWHVVAINSEIIVNPVFADADRKAQEDWLTQDLKGSTKTCTMAYWHHPRFSSGWHGTDTRLLPIWQILYNGGVDLVLNGHDHDYERFLPQTPDGVIDSTKGITEIIAGTGGGELRGFRTQLERNSAFRLQGHFGVLKLTLGPKGYQWAFVDVNRSIWDPGAGTCH
jgi:hypothetical protein